MCLQLQGEVKPFDIMNDSVGTNQHDSQKLYLVTKSAEIKIQSSLIRTKAMLYSFTTQI